MAYNVTAVLITRERYWPKDVPIAFDFDEVIVETLCPNVRRRYELALEARNEVIYVQDDDMVVDIAALWPHYDGRLTNAMIPGMHDIYKDTGVTLVGYGAFFPKALINFSRWEKQYGEVDAMEADRIFTYLAQPHNVVFQPPVQIDRPVKMCQRPCHYEVRQKFFNMLKELP